MKNYLNFETDIKDLETELEKLKDPYNQEGLSEVNTDKISKIQSEIDDKLNEVYSNLNSWQTTLVARHEDRPKSKFFIENLFDDFIPLSGDRFYGEDKSVLTGFAKFNGNSVLVIGQEKGEDLDSRIERNFGMMRPEGYRKTIRLMKLADKFNIPIISFIDTPGAYPGVGAEERGQAEAIASSIECCMSLEVPIISIIIGEGGSGGALAIEAPFQQAHEIAGRRTAGIEETHPVEMIGDRAAIIGAGARTTGIKAAARQSEQANSGKTKEVSTFHDNGIGSGMASFKHHQSRPMTDHAKMKCRLCRPQTRAALTFPTLSCLSRPSAGSFMTPSRRPGPAKV